MNTTAYILAGGKGTRLKGVVSDVPKPMADIAGRPFLFWQIEWLKRNGISDIVLLVCYLSEAIQDYFGDGSRCGVRVRYSVESEPLGTGGALLHAMDQYPSEAFVICNGDTFFDINLAWFIQYALGHAGLWVALKYRSDTCRFGNARINNDYRVLSMREKCDDLAEGYINGGIYAGKYMPFHMIDRKKFSFETEVFPLLIEQQSLFGIPFGDRFIDIGVPDDYMKAKTDIPLWFSLKKNHALFLSRDGVLIEGKGCRVPESGLCINEKSVPIIKNANRRGYKVIVITDQAEAGNDHGDDDSMHEVNRIIEQSFSDRGVRIDGWYECPYYPQAGPVHDVARCLCCKPNPGILLQACEENSIDAVNAFMIGNKDSDVIALPYVKNRLIPGRYPITLHSAIISWEKLALELHGSM